MNRESRGDRSAARSSHAYAIPLMTFVVYAKILARVAPTAYETAGKASRISAKPKVCVTLWGRLEHDTVFPHIFFFLHHLTINHQVRRATSATTPGVAEMCGNWTRHHRAPFSRISHNFWTSNHRPVMEGSGLFAIRGA